MTLKMIEFVVSVRIDTKKHSERHWRKHLEGSEADQLFPDLSLFLDTEEIIV